MIALMEVTAMVMVMDPVLQHPQQLRPAIANTIAVRPTAPISSPAPAPALQLQLRAPSLAPAQFLQAAQASVLLPRAQPRTAKIAQLPLPVKDLALQHELVYHLG
jgi:hypothetical protein